MKRLSIENIGFTEIGGIGEMKYTAVKFPEYVIDYINESEESIWGGSRQMS